MPIVFKSATAGQGHRPARTCPITANMLALGPARRASATSRPSSSSGCSTRSTSTSPPDQARYSQQPDHGRVRAHPRAHPGRALRHAPRPPLGLVRLRPGHRWAGASSSPGSARFWGGRVAQALEADPDVDVIVGLDTREPTRRARAHRVRAQRRELLDPQPHRAGHPGRHHRPHVPGRRLHRRCGASTHARDQRDRHHEPVRRGVGAGQHGARRGGEVVDATSTARPAGPGLVHARRRRAPHPPGNRVERSLEAVEGYVRDFAEDNPHVNVSLLRFSNVLGPDIVTPISRALELPLVPSHLRVRPPLPVRARGRRRPLDPVRARPPPARHLQRRRRRPAAVERGRRHLRQAHRSRCPRSATGLATWPLRRSASTLPDELLDLLRYGRGVDNRRLKRGRASATSYTSAGAVQAFVEALRLRAHGRRPPSRPTATSATSSSSSATPPRSSAIPVIDLVTHPGDPPPIRWSVLPMAVASHPA